MHSIVIYRDKRGLGFQEAAKLIRRAAKAALKAQDVLEDSVVNIMLTDDRGIHLLNLSQRGIDSPTDVLSFPLNQLKEGNFDPSICEYDYETGRLLLGDVVIDLERCAKQAEEYGHSFAREVSYLTVHSILHLLGYDHTDEGERKRNMRARENLIMGKLFPEEDAL